MLDAVAVAITRTPEYLLVRETAKAGTVDCEGAYNILFKDREEKLVENIVNELRDMGFDARHENLDIVLGDRRVEFRTVKKLFLELCEADLWSLASSPKREPPHSGG
ncbi:hypothetical protein [Pyrococcus kukulkanii]|uniref:Uncharacterized protein n=1 Tax=Pyrococcus kukulkanii TaxID=1609559 RepID=A0ABV4T643_9EURY